MKELLSYEFIGSVFPTNEEVLASLLPSPTKTKQNERIAAYVLGTINI